VKGAEPFFTYKSSHKLALTRIFEKIQDVIDNEATVFRIVLGLRSGFFDHNLLQYQLSSLPRNQCPDVTYRPYYVYDLQRKRRLRTCLSASMIAAKSLSDTLCVRLSTVLASLA